MNVKGLKARNAKLAGELKKSKAAGVTMENSLSSLVQAAAFQTNLTSFNPIIQNNIYAPLTINWNMLMYMYKTHGVLQTAIDMPVLDAFRGGIEIQSDELDTEDIEEVLEEMEEDGIDESMVEAVTWKRLFGGAALIVNTDQDMATPLSFDKSIKKLKFYACNRWELMSVWKPGEPTDLNPWVWAAAKNSEYVYFYGQRVHISRVLTMSGKAAPYILRWQLQGWGMSEMERMVEDFNAYIKTKNVIYDLLQVAKTDIYKIKGYKAALATESGTQMMNRRLAKTNELRNFNDALVMDSEDDFEARQLTFSGLAEVMKENRIGIASALRMPMTKLYGIGATGFNSGEDDIENYNAMVDSEVRQPFRRVLRTVLKLKFLQKFGFIPSFKFAFKPLRVLSAVEEEQVKTQKHTRYTSDYDRGLLTSQEYGTLLQKENLMPIKTAAADGLLDDHPEPNPMAGEDADGTEKKEETKDGKGKQ